MIVASGSLVAIVTGGARVRSARRALYSLLGAGRSRAREHHTVMLSTISIRAAALAACAIYAGSASAQGPCAEATVVVLGRSRTPLPAAEVAFHPVVRRAGGRPEVGADSVASVPAYTGRTGRQGRFVLRGASVREYVVRVRAPSGGVGEARFYCASASRRVVQVQLREPAD